MAPATLRRHDLRVSFERELSRHEYRISAVNEAIHHHLGIPGEDVQTAFDTRGELLRERVLLALIELLVYDVSDLQARIELHT